MHFDRGVNDEVEILTQKRSKVAIIPLSSKCGNFSNYLNTPGDNWYLGMRVYRPADSIIDGNYDMPVPTLVSC